MATTLTLVRHDDEPKMATEAVPSLRDLHRQAATALDVLADEMHKRDPLLHAVSLLTRALDARCEWTDCQWLQDGVA